mgnify:CR=1 FL=1
MNSHGFFAIAFSAQVVPRALRVALVVGTLLALINHGDSILSMSMGGEDMVKVALTYLVPYGVSTWSAVGAIKASSAANG